jgi:hypothetical protein
MKNFLSSYWDNHLQYIISLLLVFFLMPPVIFGSVYVTFQLYCAINPTHTCVKK